MVVSLSVSRYVNVTTGLAALCRCKQAEKEPNAASSRYSTRELEGYRESQSVSLTNHCGKYPVIFAASVFQ